MKRWFLMVGLLLMFAPRAEAQLANARVITLEAAKGMAAAAQAEARRNNWNVAIAIVDSYGGLVYFERLDGTQPASLDIAVQKAQTAARFKRPTKALDDAVSAGRVAFMAVEGIMPLEGGIPIVVDGETIGAVGVSGVTSQQDAQVAQAGIDALRR